MKLITAIVKPFKLDDIKAALEGFGVHGMTVSEAHGYGRQRGHVEVYRGADTASTSYPRPGWKSWWLTRTPTTSSSSIGQGASTGKIGDGKIWLTPVENVTRIRTGDRGTDAI